MISITIPRELFKSDDRIKPGMTICPLCFDAGVIKDIVYLKSWLAECPACRVLLVVADPPADDDTIPMRLHR